MKLFRGRVIIERYLHDADVVRHRLVREIIRAYAEDSGD